MMDHVIAIATFSGMPDHDSDWPVLRAALDDAGVEAEAVSWDAAGVDWTAYELVVVRSTWDYTERLGDFLAWADAVPRLLNPAAVIRWNTDKRYLGELADAGVPVVPTLWNPVDLPAGEGWDRFVIKPTVSAGARNTAVWGPGEEEEARAHLQALAGEGRTVMVQPYLSGIDTSGETSLIFIDGEFSHAARKPAILSRGSGLHTSPVLTVNVRDKIVPVAPSTAELAVAELALASAPRRGDLLYARVDLIPGPDGEPVVLELELTKPSLFLGHHESAPARLAAAIKSRL